MATERGLKAFPATRDATRPLSLFEISKGPLYMLYN